jgi:hypothetical protein
MFRRRVTVVRDLCASAEIAAGGTRLRSALPHRESASPPRARREPPGIMITI